MQRTWTNFSKQVTAIGLTAALALGGAAGMGTAAFVEEAYAANLVSATSDITTSTTFTFSDTGIEATGSDSGYKIEGTDLTINAAGTYRVTGSCADGTIAVKKGVTDVTIILDNLTLSKDGDKAIKFKAGSAGTLVLLGNNSLSTNNDKGVIKANAAADDNDNIVYASDGTTTGGDLVIAGDGTLNLSSDYTFIEDGETEGCDGINCEGDLTVLGGTYNISVTDDGMHADNTLTIGANGTAGPTINIAKATEGLEGASVNLLSGSGDIATTDDGINAANKDLASYGWQYGIDIAGGTWKVVAGGDGLDSNGNLAISGGTTEVYCTGSGNGALDYGEGQEGEIVGTFTVSGGTLFAVGSDMMVTPSVGTYVMFGGQGGMGMQPGFGRQSVVSEGTEIEQQANLGRPGGNSPQQSSGSVVTKGQTVAISSAGKTLFETTASASGAYALFASDGLEANAQASLANGSTTTTATAGAGSANGNNQQPGQNGQQPPALPGGQQPTDDQQPPALPSGQQPTDGQTSQPATNEGGEGTTQSATETTANSSSSATKQAKNTMTVSKRTKTVKARAVASKAKKVSAIKVKNAKGTVTYTKVSGSKYLKVNKKTGKIVVKKGTPAGTYKIKVKVKASGNDQYKSATKKVTVKIKVK